MGDVIAIFLLAFTLHVNAKDVVMKDTTSAQDLTERLRDKLTENLFERALQVWLLSRADLDKTTFAKPGHLSIRGFSGPVSEPVISNTVHGTSYGLNCGTMLEKHTGHLGLRPASKAGARLGWLENQRLVGLHASKMFEVSKPLGLVLEDVSSGIGAKIVEINPDGNSAKLGGMEKEMRLLSVNGKLCKDAPFDDIMTMVGDLDPSAKVQLEMEVKETEAAVEASEPKTVTVRVLQKGKDPIEIEAMTGSILRDTLIENKIDVYDWFGKGMNCGGAGQCLTCLVDVNSGCGDRTDYESEKLQSKPKSWRLACQTNIQGPAEVQTKPQER